MVAASILAHALLSSQIRNIDAIQNIKVTINTGEDDLRADSGIMVIMQYTGGRHQVSPVKRPDEAFASNSTKTITITPSESGLKLPDLEHIQIDFHSGNGTGYDDHWSLQGVTVTATVNGQEVIVYNNRNLGMKLMYSQRWTSPIFPGAKAEDTIDPADFWAEIEGGDPAPSNTSLVLDLETTDGRFWVGRRSGSQIADPRYPGARVEARTSDKLSVNSIRAVRIGFGQSAMSSTDSGDRGGNWTMRGVRLCYKDSSGNRKEFASYNEINFRFGDGGWWQSPIYRRFDRHAGNPLGLLRVEVLTGKDDLRRLNWANGASNHYDSKVDITFGIPAFSSLARYGNWLIDPKNPMHEKTHTQPIIEQDGDEFPEGWTGHYGSWGRFSKDFITRDTH